MQVELPELTEISAKVDRILKLLEGDSPRPTATDDAARSREIPGMRKDILTAQELADHIGVSKSTLYKYTSARTIPHLKIGNRLLFRTEEIDGWLEGQSVSVIGSR